MPGKQNLMIVFGHTSLDQMQGIFLHGPIVHCGQIHIRFIGIFTAGKLCIPQPDTLVCGRNLAVIYNVIRLLTRHIVKYIVIISA